MNRFTNKKSQLLDWIMAGNAIEQCSEPGPSFGKFSGTENCPIAGIEPVINRLLRDGKLQYETFLSFGMRWERYIPVISGKLPENKNGM